MSSSQGAESRAARSGAFWPRAASAVVLAPMAIGCVLAGGGVFAALVALCACLMSYEWSRLSEPGAAERAAILNGAVLVGMVILAYAGRPAEAALLGIGGVGLVAGAAWLRRSSVLWPVLGLLYIGVPSVALVWLRVGPEQGARLILWTLVLVWAVDTGAYAVGRTFGGPRLVSRISPGKTWSGLAGGVAAGALAGFVGGAWLDVGAPPALAGLGVLLACLEQGGDLAESAFKRRWRAKDAGHLIPGHGGRLDRLDGLLAVAPAVALLAALRTAQGAPGLL